MSAERPWEDAPLVEEAAPAQPAAPVAANPRPWEDAPLADPEAQSPAGAAFDWVLRNIKSAYEGVSDAVTGDSRREFDYPELPMLAGGKMTDEGYKPSGLSFAQTDKARAEIAAKETGGEVSYDKFGNPIIMYEGKPHYINRPGMSTRDFDEAGAQFVTSLPFASLGGGLGGKALGLIGRALGTGTGAGVASLAQDKLAEASGAVDAVDPTRAAINAAAGAGFELLAPAASAIYRQVIGNPQLYDPVAGKLTIIGKMKLRASGLDPDQVTDDFAQKFATMANQAVDPKMAAQTAQAQSLPVEVPLTRGQTTGKASDQMFESLAYKGAYGRRAEDIMRGQSARQQEALTANADEIARRVAGGNRVVMEPGMGGQIAQDALVTKADAAKAGVDAAYDAARGAGAGMPAQEIGDLSRLIGMTDDVAGRLEFAPKAQVQLKALDKLSAQGDDATVMVKSLFDWRRQTTNLAAEANDRTEAAALKAMVRRFDEALPEMVKDGLMTGDQAAVDAWKAAIASNREFAKAFRAKDLVADLVAKDGGTLKIPPESAANYIFGVSDAKLMTGMTIARDLNKVKTLLGENSEAWNALREEAFMRFLRAGQGNYDHATGARQFSGAKFASFYDNVAAKNPAVMKSLFTEDELKLIGQFKNVAQRVTTTSRGGDNYSNTTPAAANIVQKMMGAGFIGDKAMATLMAVAKPASNILNEIRTRLATDFEAPMRTIAPGIVGALGATGIDPALEERLRAAQQQ